MSLLRKLLGRSGDAYGAPELAVDRRKQERMVKAALGYLKQKQLHQMACGSTLWRLAGTGRGTSSRSGMPSRWSGTGTDQTHDCFDAEGTEKAMNERAAPSPAQ